ncbi:alpha/beta hydrolase [Agrobacterium tumefaciens]|uniref:alpha/beta hydrolase n=1 Tax=Agrobacterium tumefaciens TaxID=358 RepID=UPI0021CE2DE5|nr:alpha/beta hydrolase [Agrobacterium tumefaciens]UXS05612.1 alpha/beta hydrolase [Agrobacterium tumefaciens]
MRLLVSLFLVLITLSSCARRPGSDVLQARGTKVHGAKTVTAYVASTRQENDQGKGFGTKRAARANYARFDISIPPQHEKGEIEWARGAPNPKTDFVVTRANMLRELEFNTHLGRIAKSGKQIGLFVHGYNHSYQEALFRAAQMAADADIDGVPVVFSWPSQAKVTGYIADKQSATYSRDALANVISNLALQSPERKIIVFGHSMGGWLVMEALRQLRFQGRDDVIAKLQVVLAAPDIDADVFRKQVEVVGRLKPPLTVMVSRDDRALKVSSLLGADVKRIGALNVENPAVQRVALRYGVQFIDVSDVEASGPLNHDRYTALAALLPQLEKSVGRQGTEFGRAGAFVFDAIGVTLSSPFHLASQIVNPEH